MYVIGHGSERDHLAFVIATDCPDHSFSNSDAFINERRQSLFCRPNHVVVANPLAHAIRPLSTLQQRRNHLAEVSNPSAWLQPGTIRTTLTLNKSPLLSVHSLTRVLIGR